MNPFNPTTKAASANLQVTAETLGDILVAERAHAEKRYASILEAAGNEIADNRKMIAALEARITQLEDVNWQPKAVA